MQYREFGTPVPCNTTWDRAIDIFKTIGGAFTDNASVHIIPRGSNWWALTESITGTLLNYLGFILVPRNDLGEISILINIIQRTSIVFSCYCFVNVFSIICISSECSLSKIIWIFNAGAFAIDPSNLFTTAQIEYDDQLGGPSDLTTAHPSVLENGDMVNIISTPGIGFRLYRLPQSSSLQFEEEGTYLSHDCRPRKAKIQRELIAKIPHRHFIAPSWIHDFPSTQNYVILFETPIYFNLASLLFGSETSYLFMDWKPEEGTLVHVVRLSDGAVASCRAPPFFAFHYANAWEENLDGSEVIDSNSNRKNSKQAVLDKQSKKLIYIDAAIYSDPTIVNHLKLENMRITPEAAAELPPSQIRRLCLEISEDFSSVAVISNTRQAAERGAAPYSLETVWKKLANDVTVFGNYADFPSVNPSKKGYKHRYVWGICAVRPAMQAQGIAKWDTETGETKVWSEVAGIVNEPVFVPRPGATAEDDGAIVVTVIQPNGKTAVVIIDGQTHQELARAVLLNGTLTVGFHGSFVPSWQ